MHHVSKLKNGINLITIPVKGTKATTVLVLLPIGSRYEHAKISGISHFVEHMMFKGTTKRPTAMDITRELDAVGADFNAFTGKEYTGYYVKIDSAKQELAFDLLSDMIFNSKMDESEMNKEKGVIVEELRMYEDNPTMFINRLFDQILLGDYPLGWDIGGTKQTVTALSSKELWNYYKSAYIPSNMVLVVAGNIDNKKMKKFVDQYFANRSVRTVAEKRNKNSFAKFVWPKEKSSINSRVLTQVRKVDQSHILLGFPGLANNHPKRFAAAVMLYILGGGMSSRLFEEVREKRGLAYVINAGADSFRDTGMVFVRAGLDPARLPEALKVIKEELIKISEEGVTPHELKDAKNSISGRMALSMEESNVQADWYARQFWFMREIQTPDDMLKRIRKVTAQEVKGIAKELFDFDLLHLAAIGPLEKEAILKMIV